MKNQTDYTFGWRYRGSRQTGEHGLIPRRYLSATWYFQARDHPQSSGLSANTGYVEFDDEAELLHGEVLDARDVITFQGKTVEEVRKAFRDSIDDYLEFCAERNEKPEKPFSGKFVVRLPSELHHRVYIKAMEQGKSLNQFVVESIDKVI